MMRSLSIIFPLLWFLTGSLCMRQDKPPQNGQGKYNLGRDEYGEKRRQMVATQIKARGVEDERVLAAMLTVARHQFVPEQEWHLAYEDFPLPIGYEQTISQPYIVAYMTDVLDVKPGDRILEIGTGSGYQAAVLSLLAQEVFSIEIVAPLCAEAATRLQKLGYANVQVRCGDGYAGWPEKAPFDAIIITAAPEKIPSPLLDQLAPNGRMILPLGGYYQELVLIRKDQHGQLNRQNLIPVRFVPMTGKAEK